jgi:hypothetical protein
MKCFLLVYTIASKYESLSFSCNLRFLRRCLKDIKVIWVKKIVIDAMEFNSVLCNKAIDPYPKTLF